jgi:phosphate transport system substrate-binding protein
MTNRKNDLPALLLTLLITLGLLAGGAWFVSKRLFSGLGQSSQSNQPQASGSSSSSTGSSSSSSTSSSSSQSASASTTLDTSLPNPNVLAIDGSVSLVALIKQLQIAYLQANPTVPTTYGLPDGKPNGTNAGIQNLINGKVNLAVSSRPLTAAEVQAGLQAKPIARDALAVAVGIDNPYKGGLSLDQLRQIFQGKITNWSQVGGPDLPIRVVNRSPNSGTYSFFKDVVLLGDAFAPDGPNFTTAQQDETTPLLRSLGQNGITYSSVTQTENQQTVRIVPINNIAPTDANAVKTGIYPISRIAYLVVPKQTSPAVKQFIDLALSPQGQQSVQRLGFTPIQ